MKGDLLSLPCVETVGENGRLEFLIFYYVIITKLDDSHTIRECHRSSLSVYVTEVQMSKDRNPTPIETPPVIRRMVL